MPTTELYSMFTEQILNALQYQGSSNDCGPYITATLLKAIQHLEIDPAELARQMNTPNRRGWKLVIRRFPNWATFPWGITDVLNANGMTAEWHICSTSTELTETLREDRLGLIISGTWQPLRSHVMLLVSWHYQKGWGFANTQKRIREIDWVDDINFQKQWRAMGRMRIEVKDLTRRTL